MNAPATIAHQNNHRKDTVLSKPASAASMTPPGWYRNICAQWIVTLILTVAVTLDALNGTLFTIARPQIMGATGSTPDEVAWINLAYLMAKVACLPAAAWWTDRIGETRILAFAIVFITLSSLVCAVPANFPALIAGRVIQGTAGATLLVAAQTIVFRLFGNTCQPVAQAVFALGIVMAPTTLAPAVQGVLTDEISWHWVFWLNTFLGAFVLLFLLPFAQYLPNSRQVFAAFDWIGFLIFAGAMTTLLYVLLEGPRWNWFDDPHIVAIALVCLCCLAALVVWAWLWPHRSTMFNSTVFSESHFTFGFFVSFVAGFAMFGSAFLIPAFALNVLALPATDAGLLLLPSSLAVGSGLLAAGILISANNLSPLKFVPLGILLMMAAMWMMSRSTLESGADDLWLALLIRGFGLGFLFLAITQITFKSILPNQTAAGVAMFNFGRQLGGIIGISFLTTFINDRIAENRTVLIEHIDAGSLIFQMRQTSIAETLQLRGLDPGLASGTAANIVQNTVQQQVASLSFNDAFFSLVMLFVFAVPLVLLFKLGQALNQKMKPVRGT